MEQNLNGLENELIMEHFLLLNIAGNPKAMEELTDLRNSFKKIARG